MQEFLTTCWRNQLVGAACRRLPSQVTMYPADLTSIPGGNFQHATDTLLPFRFPGRGPAPDGLVDWLS